MAPDKQIYYCFGCHHGGGAIQFAMEIENLSFPDAVRFLAKRANMDVPEDNADREESRRRQRAHGGYRVVKARLVEGNDVDVAFA